jgi:COP9 signalosome complex subunit 2
MLALSDINPFAAREAKVFQEEKEVMAMQNLRAAYESNDLPQFERILSNSSNRIVNDPFIMLYVTALRRRMREQVLINLLLPYQRIKLNYLSSELKLDMKDVERLLVDMIIDKRINGKIDQINGVLSLAEKDTSVVKTKNYDALDQWTEALTVLSTNLNSKVNY